MLTTMYISYGLSVECMSPVNEHYKGGLHPSQKVETSVATWQYCKGFRDILDIIGAA